MNSLPREHRVFSAAMPVGDFRIRRRIVCEGTQAVREGGGLYPLQPRNSEPGMSGREKEGPYRAVGPSPVQSIAAYCTRLQSRRRKYALLITLLTDWQSEGQGFAAQRCCAAQASKARPRSPSAPPIFAIAVGDLAARCPWLFRVSGVSNGLAASGSENPLWGKRSNCLKRSDDVRSREQ